MGARMLSVIISNELLTLFVLTNETLFRLLQFPDGDLGPSKFRFDVKWGELHVRVRL